MGDFELYEMRLPFRVVPKKYVSNSRAIVVEDT
jgi:hypothetical protein